MFVRTKGKEPLGVIPIINHPVSEGRLCHRGWNRFQNLRSLNRILRPRLHDGNQVKEVSWTEALNKVAEIISNLLNAFGPQSIGVIGSPCLTNEDNFLLSIFAKTILKTNNLDGSYRFGGAMALEALERVYSSPLGSLGLISDLPNSPAILVVENSALRDFSPVGSRVIQGAIGGTTIVLADPMVRHCEHFYSLHLPYSLENLSHLFDEESAIPPEIRGKFNLPNCSVIFVADQVRPALSLIAFLTAFLEQLPASGKLLKIFPLSRSPNLRGAWDMGVKPGKYGLSISEMLAPESKIKGLLIFGDDLITHLPSAAMIEKVKNLEFLLVVDRFNTETSRFAHITLPLPLLAESEGTMTNCEGRVQMLRPVLSPRGESRSLMEVLGELALKLGSSLPYSSLSELRDAIGTTIPGYQIINELKNLDSLTGVILGPPKLNGIPSISLPKSRSDEGKYLLIIYNTLNSWSRNQMILESPVLKIEYPSERLGVKINPQDARELKIRMGEKIKIKSELGEAQLPIELDNSLPPATLVLSSHFVEVVEKLGGKGLIDGEARSLYYPNLYVTVEKA